MLLIERDPIQRATLAGVLKAAAYSVIPVCRAHDALEIFVTHHTELALVLADTESAIPAGPPVLGALHMIDPRIPVIAMSPNAAMHRLEHHANVVATLRKPFEPADLLAQVRHALHEPPGAPDFAADELSISAPSARQ